jgi:hypothetical protein
MKKIIFLSLAIVVLAAFFASTHPDGLDKTAKVLGFASRGAENHSIMTGYALPFLPEGPISTAFSGLVGLGLIFGLFQGIKLILSR